MECLQRLISFLRSLRKLDFFKLAKFKKNGPKQNTRSATSYVFRGMTVIGILTPKTYVAFFTIWRIFLNGLGTFYMPIAFCISFLIRMDSFTPSAFLTSLQVTVNCFGCSSKIIVFYFLYKKLLKALKYTDLLDIRIKGPEEEEQIRKMVAFCNRSHLLFMVLYFSYSSSTSIPAVLNGRPPYQFYNPIIEWTAKRQHFYIQSAIEYFMINIHCYQQAVLDSYPVIYISIVRTHLQILAQRITKLGSDPKLNSKERYEALVQCIFDHKNIMKFYNEFRQVVSGTLFVQFMITGVILGIAIVNIFIYADASATLGTIFFILSMLAETFPCSFMANWLIDDSDNLPLAIFHSNWPDEESRYKRTILIFLQNTQKTMVLTAMKIFPITLNSNINVVKFAFSVYTMIKHMNFGPNKNVEDI